MFFMKVDNSNRASTQPCLPLQLQTDHQTVLPLAESDYDNANLGSRGSSARSRLETLLVKS